LIAPESVCGSAARRYGLVSSFVEFFHLLRAEFFPLAKCHQIYPSVYFGQRFRVSSSLLPEYRCVIARGGITAEEAAKLGTGCSRPITVSAPDWYESFLFFLQCHVGAASSVPRLFGRHLDAGPGLAFWALPSFLFHIQHILFFPAMHMVFAPWSAHRAIGEPVSMICCPSSKKKTNKAHKQINTLVYNKYNYTPQIPT